MPAGFVLPAKPLPNRPLDLQEVTMETVQTMLAEADAEVPASRRRQVRAQTGRADVLFLDVREPAEVAESGKVPGARVPRRLVEFRPDAASPMMMLRSAAPRPSLSIALRVVLPPWSAGL